MFFRFEDTAACFNKISFLTLSDTSSFDTKIQVWGDADACSGGVPNCVDGNNDSDSKLGRWLGYDSEVNVPSPALRRYYVWVGGNEDESGTFELYVHCTT